MGIPPSEDPIREAAAQDRRVAARVATFQASVLQHGQAQSRHQPACGDGHGHPPRQVEPGGGADPPGEAVADVHGHGRHGCRA